MTVNIRRARPGDEAELVAMMRELAEFEHAADECTVTEAQLHDSAVRRPRRRCTRTSPRSTASPPRWRCGSATSPRGTAWPASTWRTCSCGPTFRRHGLARALLATLARNASTSGYTRLSWAVLDWNVNAIALYDAVGGKPQTEWITYRVSGTGVVGARGVAESWSRQPLHAPTG